jgi:DNA-binding transcriptional LysR family regulator
LEFIIPLREIMDRFLEMRIFVAVAEEQGFAAAARRLQLSPPAVTRAIASLEASLGVLLLNRTTRSVRVTEPGQRYLEDARRILSAVESADDAVSGINASPTGRLSITGPCCESRRGRF